MPTTEQTVASELAPLEVLIRTAKTDIDLANRDVTHCANRVAREAESVAKDVADGNHITDFVTSSAAQLTKAIAARKAAYEALQKLEWLAARQAEVAAR